MLHAGETMNITDFLVLSAISGLNVQLTPRFELYCFFIDFFSASCLLAKSLILLSDASRCLQKIASVV